MLFRTPLKFFLGFLLLFLVSFDFVGDQKREYAIKSAMIFKFSKYVRWENPSPDLVMGILGQRGKEKLLTPPSMLTIQNKKVRVTYLEDISEVDKVDLLFIGKEEAKKWDKIQPKLVNKKILTISEMKGMGEKGVMVNLVVNERSNKIDIELNRTSIKESGLNVNAQIYTVAKKIYQ